MRSGGWKPFWATLGATLLLLLPLIGGTALLSRQRLRSQLRQAAQSQSGVPIPTAVPDAMSLLICTPPQTDGELPEFLLLYLDPAQQRIALLSVPAQLYVPFAQTDTSLAQCYAAAGPARCRQALAGVLPLPENTHYLALSVSTLESIADRYGAVRLSLAGTLSAEALERHGQTGGVQALLAADARALLCQLERDAALSPADCAAVRAAVWDAFLRQNLDLLPSTLPDALRRSSSSLLTDWTALDYAALGEVLEFFTSGEILVESCALPGEWDAQTGTYSLTEASLAAVQSWCSAAPAAGQSASRSEP